MRTRAWSSQEVRGRVDDAKILLGRNIVFAFSAEKVALGRKGVFLSFFFLFLLASNKRGRTPFIT